MARYLQADGARSALAAGRSIEQWLGARSSGGETALRWIRLDREKDGTFSATVFDVFDDGSTDFRDIYEFSPVDIDQPHGSTRSFAMADEAIQHAIDEYGATRERFVNAGVIQDEYSEYRGFDNSERQ